MVLRITVSYAVAATLLMLLTAGAAFAQQESGGQSLDQAASDPTASLMSVQIQDIYSGDYHILEDASSNTVMLRSAIPFKLGGISNIARITLPYITDSPSGETGLSDTILFDLIVFNQDWGRWGVGPVLLLPTASDDALGAEKWAIGPALGFTARGEGLLWGLFNQNLFSVAGDDDREDVNVSILQPIVNYSLPNKWSLGTSEMNFTYDWEQSAWTSLPLGIKLNKLMRFGQQPVQFSGSYEHNFQDDFAGPEWTVNFTVKLLFPL